ncbi:MAG: tetratricopeptide repeat protein [Terriglobia bacterium]
MVSYLSLILLLVMQAPPQTDALYRSGLASLQARHFQEAEASFREVYRLDPENIRGLAGIAQTYIAQAKFTDALDLLRSESEKQPKRADIHVAIGETAALSGQPDAALAEFQKALGLLDVVSTQTAGIYLRIGEVCRLKGDSKASLEALRKAAELAPRDATILASLGMGLDNEGDRKGAMEKYRASLAINAQNPVVQNNLAFIIADTGGDYYEALRLARAAKDSSPGTIEISDTIGWISLKLGWVDEAIDGLSDVVRAQPDKKSFREHLLAAISQKRNPPPAFKDLKAALLEDPTPANQQKIRELLKKP